MNDPVIFAHKNVITEFVKRVEVFHRPVAAIDGDILDKRPRFMGAILIESHGAPTTDWWVCFGENHEHITERFEEFMKEVKP